MKILLTGFEPFGENETNVSWNVVAATPQIDGVELLKLQVPVSFHRASSFVIDVIAKEHPDVVLLFGQSKRKGINVERVAINITDATKPDNDDYIPRDEIIQPNGENAYFATIPIKKIVAHLQENGFNAKVSNSAGTYVCNTLFYNVLHYVKSNNLNIKVGFIHIYKELRDTTSIGEICCKECNQNEKKN